MQAQQQDICLFHICGSSKVSLTLQWV